MKCKSVIALVPRGLLLLLIVVLGSCAVARVDELASSSAISFSAPGFYLPPGAALRWRSEVVYLFEGSAEEPPQFERFLRDEIEASLTSRGHVFVDDTDAPYGVAAVAVLASDVSAAAVLREFSLTPSFPTSRRYPKGTLVVAIYSRPDEVVQWRGAIQANISLSLPAEERQRRVREHVRRLLNLVPSRAY